MKKITKRDILQIKDRNDNKLELLKGRWNEIIWYKLPDYTTDVNSLLILGNKDVVLRKKSIKKIKAIFMNIKIKYIESDHFNFQPALAKEKFSIIDEFLEGKFKELN